jgi:hypothetical protein
VLWFVKIVALIYFEVWANGIENTKLRKALNKLLHKHAQMEMI